MKQNSNQTPAQKQKWILPTLLVAALASNYYFQVPSNNYGAIEMMSETATPKVEVKMTKPVDAKPVDPKSEGEVVQLKKEDYQKFLAYMEKIKADSEKKPETEKEKRERAKKEKEDAKKEKEAIKKEKDDDARAVRSENFTEQLKAAAATCNGDFKCSFGEMTTLLESLTGENKIDASVVTKAFNTYIAKDLRAALKNPDSAADVLTTLHDMGADFPADYRFLKDKTVDVLKSDALVRGMEVNRNFKMADSFISAKRPIEARQYLMTAQQQREELTYSSNLIYATTMQGLQQGHDITSMDYMKRTYFPDVTKMIGNLSNLNGLGLTDNSTTLSNEKNQSTASTRLATRSANSPATAEKPAGFQNDNQSGVQIGSPQPGQRLKRGAIQ